MCPLEASPFRVFQLSDCTEPKSYPARKPLLVRGDPLNTGALICEDWERLLPYQCWRNASISASSRRTPIRTFVFQIGRRSLAFRPSAQLRTPYSRRGLGMHQFSFNAASTAKRRDSFSFDMTSTAPNSVNCWYRNWCCQPTATSSFRMFRAL